MEMWMQAKTRVFVTAENHKFIIPFLNSEYPKPVTFQRVFVQRKKIFVHYSQVIAVSLKLQPGGTTCYFILCM